MDQTLRRSSRLKALTENKKLNNVIHTSSSTVISQIHPVLTKRNKALKSKSKSKPKQTRSFSSKANTNHVNIQRASLLPDGSNNTTSSLLLNIAPLVKGEVLRRPSAQIKSPYVADVQILPNGPTVLAHAPALDVGGLCAPGSIVYLSSRSGTEGKTSHAIELVQSSSSNKKDAEQSHNNNARDDSTTNDPVLVGAHPRLGETLAEKILKLGLLEDLIGFGPADDYVKKTKKTSKKEPSKRGRKRKSIQKDDPYEHEDESSISKGALPLSQETECSAASITLTTDTNDLKSKTVLRKQCTYGDSRVDFELSAYPTRNNQTESTNPDKIAIVEVKNVVCADYSIHDAPKKRNSNHCVIIAPSSSSPTKGSTSNSKENQMESPTKTSTTTPYQRSGLFPWGRIGQTFEGQKVVSARAIKHIRNLVEIGGQSQNKPTLVKPIVKKIQPIILFVVNRSDCFTMRPCHEVCPMFAKELKHAAEKGVQVIAVRVKWNEAGEVFYGGIIPVQL